MQAQLKVIKADGSLEEYLHTKVIGTINNALGRVGQAEISTAEQLAEVVTYYLYGRQGQQSVSSSEVFSIIQTVLASTGFEDAAIALGECHFQRKLRRSRIEVVAIDVRDLPDAELLAGSDVAGSRYRWDKSRIAEDVEAKYGVCRQTARAIASMVEEKVFSIGMTLVPESLIKQFVLGDTAAVLRAQHELQAV